MRKNKDKIVVNKTKFIARTAVIAALYASLTLALAPFSYGAVQFRVSEALTILPLFYVEAIPGLSIGCLIANMFSGGIDMVVGTLATLIAAVITYFSRKIYLGVFPPVILNALLVPVIFLTMPDITSGYWLNVLTVGLGEAGVVFVLGVALYYALKPLTKKYKVLSPLYGQAHSEK